MIRFWSRIWLGSAACVALVIIGVVALRQRPNVGAAVPNAPSVRAPHLSSESGSGEWAMEGYNPARTRAIDTTISLPISRQREVTAPTGKELGSPVTIGNKTLLVEADHRLRAFDLRSGKERWAVASTGQYLSPAIAGNSVFIRSEAANQGEVLALDIRTGKQQWTFRPRRISGPETGYWGGHLTSPVIAQGIVYIGAGKELYALDAATGAAYWEYSADDYIFSSATIGDGQVFISDAGHIHAIDQLTGKLIWKTPTELSIYFSPIVANHSVFLTNGQKLLALDTRDGSQRWELAIENQTLIPGAVQGSVLIAKSSTMLFALDLESGTEIWRYQHPHFVSLPVVAGDHLFAVTGATGQGGLTVFDIATGETLWSESIPSLATTAPVIAGSTLYAQTIDGRILGFSN